MKTTEPRPPAWWFVGALIRRTPGVFALHMLYVTSLAYVLPFLPPLVVRAILDRLTDRAPAGPSMATLIGIFVALGLVRAVAEATGHTATTTLRQYVRTLLRRNMLDRVLQRPGARALPASTGEALARFENEPEAVSMTVDFAADPLGQIFAYAFAFLVLGNINLFLTAVVVTPAVLVMLIAHIATPRIHEARRKRQEAVGDVAGLIGEAFSAIASVKAAGAEARITARLGTLNDVRRRATLRDLLVTQMLSSVSANVAAIATGVLLLLAGSRARAGQVTAGDFAVFTSYLQWLGTVVSYSGIIIASLRQTDVSVDRMEEVLQGSPARTLVGGAHLSLRARDRESASAASAASASGTETGERFERLDAEGLRFVHPETGRGVLGVDLHIERGEVVVITGRIGSGKTTLLRTLLGLLPADSGVVRWNGSAIEDPASFLLPPRCAYTPQVPRLFSTTLRENVLLGLDRDESAVARAAHAAVLEQDVSLLEAGWETEIGTHGVKLSGGQLQRTAAARMFVRDAAVLVFDDLSSALDVETENALWRRVFEREGATCLIVSHRHAALRRADRVLVMEEGHLAVL
jgi:ATP-binding cassette subfamily B protein